MAQNPSWVSDVRLSANISDRPLGQWIAGDWTTSTSDTIPVIDPSTGQEIAHIQRGSRADIDQAVAAARHAFDRGPWKDFNGVRRGELMMRLADLLEVHCDELALLEALDGGKPLAVARQVDVVGNIARLRYAAGWAARIGGDVIDTALPYSNHTFSTREPVGVVAAILPWNFPLGMALSKMGAALAAGCTVVIKPAEQTSLATLRLGSLIRDAGFPDGVVNIVTGYGNEVGQALAEHNGVDKISFTGSTAVGKALLKAAAGDLKRLTLELGGKSPAIVFKDADLDVAVADVLKNFTYNAGQVCAAGSRLFVEKTIFEHFVAELSRKAGALAIGAAVDPRTQLGPLISERQLDRVTTYISSGLADGATLITGGQRRGDKGYFVEPTILSNIKRDMAVQREEIFGPVVTATAFESDDLEGIAAAANDTDYGLSSYVYSRDVSKVLRMARLIKAGQVHINGAGTDYTMPFGGYKQSGWGRENGREGVLGFTEMKTVTIAI